VKLSALPLLALAGLASAAETARNPAAAADDKSGIFTSGLLPDGSVLENVTLPDYDEKLHLIASMHVRHMIIHDHKTDVEGQGMSIDFFSIQKQHTGSLRLESAHYNPQFSPDSGLLRTDKPFVLLSDQLDVTGSALVYEVAPRRGYINGPVTADAVLQKATAMNTPSLHPFAIGASLVAAAAFASAEPAPKAPATTPDNHPGNNLSGRELLEKARMTPEQLKEIDDQAKPATGQDAARETAEKSVAQADKDEAMVHNALAEFATRVALTTLITTAKDPSAPEPANSSGQLLAPPKLEGPLTHVTADEGAYIDREKGIVVFLKNVEVHDEASVGSMTGADELKILFEPMPPKPDPKSAAKDGDKSTSDTKTPLPPPPTPEEQKKMKDAKEAAAAKAAEASSVAKKNGEKKPDGGMGSGMGDVQRLIATGKQVHLRQKGAHPGDKDMEAAGSMVIYDPASGEVVIKGGDPWLVSQEQSFQVHGPNSYIRYNKNTGNGVGVPGAGGTISFDLVSKEKPEGDKPKKPADAPKPSGDGKPAPTKPGDGKPNKPTPPRNNGR